MFTGIVEEQGTILSLTKYPQGLKATIGAKKVLANISLGDSIAVNGVCVTVTTFTNSTFTVDVMKTTVEKTLWAQAKIGDKVHLEGALTLAKPLGGHIVTGHVNGLGTVVSKKIEELATVLRIKPPQELMKYIIPQGSIAVNGVSLTVSSVDEETFSISLIPHTIGETNLLNATVVNLEVDILAKYLEKLISVNSEDKKDGNLTVGKLLAAGFM